MVHEAPLLIYDQRLQRCLWDGVSLHAPLPLPGEESVAQGKLKTREAESAQSTPRPEGRMKPRTALIEPLDRAQPPSDVPQRNLKWRSKKWLLFGQWCILSFCFCSTCAGMWLPWHACEGQRTRLGVSLCLPPCLIEGLTFAIAHARIAVPRASGILLSLPPHLCAVGKQRLQMHMLSHPYLKSQGSRTQVPFSYSKYFTHWAISIAQASEPCGGLLGSQTKENTI